jgi:hypothetical protein
MKMTQNGKKSSENDFFSSLFHTRVAAKKIVGKTGNGEKSITLISQFIFIHCENIGEKSIIHFFWK